MSDQPEPEIPVEPEDPQVELEQHVKYRRKHEILSLTQAKLVSQNLSDFTPVMSGAAYAFTSLKIRNAGLKEISDEVKQYCHLRRIDLSLNVLKQITNLLQLKYVVSLDLSRNLLTNASFLSRDSYFPYMKEVNLLGNKITALPAVNLKSLRRLNLNFNIIATAEDFDGHPFIQILQLRSNKLKNVKGLKNMPELKQLYIADNQIIQLKEIQNAKHLQKINARKNKISNLNDFPKLPSLKHLNLRENQIGKVNDLLGVAENIKSINLIGNPLEAELADNVKKEVWMKFRNFARINKNEVTSEERDEFEKQYRERLAEQQRQRLEREAAEKQAKQAAEKEA